MWREVRKHGVVAMLKQHFANKFQAKAEGLRCGFGKGHPALGFLHQCEDVIMVPGFERYRLAGQGCAVVVFDVFQRDAVFVFHGVLRGQVVSGDEQDNRSLPE